MNIFKVILTLTLLLKLSAAAKETSRRLKLLEFTLPKYRLSLRTFIMLQEPWHLNILREIEGLMADDEAYSPLYDLYRDSLATFLQAFQDYAKDQDSCESTERLFEAIREARDLLFSSEDEAVKKILHSNSIDVLDIYEDYTLEFFDRFSQEFKHFRNSLGEEEQQKELNLLKWFEEFEKETNFEKKSHLFAKFFKFFQDELKYDTTLCECML